MTTGPPLHVALLSPSAYDERSRHHALRAGLPEDAVEPFVVYMRESLAREKASRRRELAAEVRAAEALELEALDSPRGLLMRCEKLIEDIVDALGYDPVLAGSVETIEEGL